MLDKNSAKKLGMRMVRFLATHSHIGQSQAEKKLTKFLLTFSLRVILAVGTGSVFPSNAYTQTLTTRCKA